MSLDELRRHYAEEIAVLCGISDSRIIEAFGKVPRERFLPKGPWMIFHPDRGYVSTSDDDPRHTYHNVRIALDSSRRLNNEEPELTASIMDAARPRAGDHVVLVGVGAGYYTAIWSEIVGPSGSVDAFEIDAALADTAARNLEEYSNVRVTHADASDADIRDVDILVASAGGNRIPRHWIDALALGGRALLPFTRRDRIGRLLKIEKTEQGMSAAFTGEPVMYFELAGVRIEPAEHRLSEAVEKYGWNFTGSLQFNCSKPCRECWLCLPEDAMCLSSSSIEKG